MGLRVTKKLSNEDRQLTNYFEPGVGLELIVSQPGKRILGIDRPASKVTSFTDDKNTDLNKTENFGGVIDSLGVRTSADGSRMGFKLRSSVLPAKGAPRCR